MAQEKSVATETSAQRHDHALGAPFGDRYLGGDGVVLVQNTRRIAEGNADIHTRVGKNGLPGGGARSRRQQAREGRVIQGQDVVFRRLGQEQRLHFLELVRHFRRQVVVLRVVL